MMDGLDRKIKNSFINLLKEKEEKEAELRKVKEEKEAELRKVKEEKEVEWRKKEQELHQKELMLKDQEIELIKTNVQLDACFNKISSLAPRSVLGKSLLNL